MVEKLDIDEKDKKIIALYEKTPDISQIDIAEHVGLSQPSVGARINKLKQSGILSTSVGMDLKRVGLNMAKVEINTKDSIKIIEQFKGCPYFLNGLIVSGVDNLCLFFIAEDISTIESIVDGHLRCNPAVNSVNLSIVITPISELVMPVKMSVERQEESPCKSDCATCAYHTSHRCLGCPVTKNYKGKFW